MRISDWSSDVCSSYLAGLGDVQRPAGDDAALGAGTAHVRTGDTRRPADHSRRTVRASDGVEPVGDVVPAVPARDAGARSEEHTSELQSLMRISYAVFCLKKKKQQTTNYEHYTHDRDIILRIRY